MQLGTAEGSMMCSSLVVLTRNGSMQWQSQQSAAEAVKAGAKAASYTGPAPHWQAAGRHGQKAEACRGLF